MTEVVEAVDAGLKLVVSQLEVDELQVLGAAVVTGLLIVPLCVWQCLRRDRSNAKCLRKIEDVPHKKGVDHRQAVLEKIHLSAAMASPTNASVSKYVQKCKEMLSQHPELVNEQLADSNDGYTPLLRACYNGNYELIRFMLEIGADVHTVNKDGESALYLAAYRLTKSSSWDDSAIELLWQAGGRVNAQNARGNAILHLAAKAGNVQLVRWLLSRGADPEVRNCSNTSPLDVANSSSGSPNHRQVAGLLDIGVTPARVHASLTDDGGILLERCSPSRSSSESSLTSGRSRSRECGSSQ